MSNDKLRRPMPAPEPRSGTIKVYAKFGAAEITLLVAGLILWFILPAGPSGARAKLPAWRWAAAVATAGIALLPPVRIWGARVCERLRAASPGARARTALGIAVVASLYFLATATNQDRDFFPKTHDECSYLIQMRMLARGRLWMPAHPLADFFDSFYLISKPVYASMYFCGTALLNVPSIWLHLPTWLIPLVVAGAIVGLIYRLIAEWVDPAAGMIASLIVISLSWYRMLSILVLSQLPVLLLGLLLLWAWSRWRCAKRPGGWKVLIGICGGWAVITRPLDAQFFILPVGVAIWSDLRGQRRAQWFKAIAILGLGAAPFLLLQAAANRGITGSLLHSPFGLYADRDFPGTSYGFHPVDPGAATASVIPQKRLLYEKWAVPFIVDHQPGRLAATWWRTRIPLMADVTLPARPLLMLLPLGLLGLATRQRWLLFLGLPLFVTGYVGYTFFSRALCGGHHSRGGAVAGAGPAAHFKAFFAGRRCDCRRRHCAGRHQLMGTEPLGKR